MTAATSAQLPTTKPARRRIPEKTLIRAQAISGLVFAVFLVLHLANFAVALFGQAAYDAFMRVARYYYRFPLFEIAAVLFAAAVHMWAGITRALRRRRRESARADVSVTASRPPWRTRLHRYSAYYVTFAFFGHVIATRSPSLLGHHVDYSFINFSMTYAGAFFYPYYTLLALAGLYHMTHGTIAALRIVGLRLPKRLTNPRWRPFWYWTAACGVLCVVAVLAIGGQLYTPDQSRHSE